MADMFRSLEDGDWKFGRGQNDFARGRDALILNLQTRLKSWRRDCFFAAFDGVDYERLLSIGTQSFLDADCKRVILQTDGVLRIDSFESVIVGREYRATARIQTVYGVLEIENA